ncbi:exocyst complex component EXO70A1 [Tanacetum coccineum]
METVKGPAVQLFNFAEAISISTRAPEKLFKILDLYDTLCDLVSDIDVVFDGKLGEGTSKTFDQSFPFIAFSVVKLVVVAVAGCGGGGGGLAWRKEDE